MVNHFTITVWGRNTPRAERFYAPSYVVNRIYYVCSGTAMYKQSIPLRPGYLYLFSADPDFEVTQNLNDPMDHVFFDFRTFLQQIQPGVTEINLDGRPILRNVIYAVAEAFRDPALPLSIAESYFRIIMHSLPEYYTPMEHLSYVTEDALCLLHESSISDISVQSLAQQCNVSTNHLIRCFKHDIGITPHRYISRLKVDLAISGCRRGERLSDIAASLGFSSVSALSVFFKNETGRNISTSRP